MTRTIAIANQKGGVGKTTTVINLGAALAEKQQKTLLIDLDAQASLTTGLGLDVNNLEKSISNIFRGEDISITELITSINPYLDLVPAEANLTTAEQELFTEFRREFVLKNILNTLTIPYDFILIDCPPNLGLLTANGLCASDQFIAPMQCEYFAMHGLQALLDFCAQIKTKLNSKLALGGILPTMYATGTVHAREVLERVQTTFGDKVFEVVIYKSIRFAEANVESQSLLEYEKTHKGAEAYKKLAQLILET